MWYKWTPPATASVASVRAQPSASFTAARGALSSFAPNLVLTVYEDTGSLSTLKLVAVERLCDPYAAVDTPYASIGQTCVSVAPGGRTFAVQVSFEWPLWGAFDLVFASSTTAAVSNDHFAGRSAVAALTPTASGSRTGASPPSRRATGLVLTSRRTSC